MHYEKKKRGHQKRQGKPIETGVNPVMTGTKPEKKVDMFIGPVDKQNSVNDMRSHMEIHNITDISDIVEIPQKSGLKAFKVTIAKSNSEAIKNIWPKGMKVDKFRENKTGSASKSNKPHNNNRHASHTRTQIRKQPFRRQGNYNHRDYNNWQGNNIHIYNNWQGNSNHRDQNNWRVNSKWQPNTGSRYTENNTWKRSQ